MPIFQWSNFFEWKNLEIASAQIRIFGSKAFFSTLFTARSRCDLVILTRAFSKVFECLAEKKRFIVGFLLI